ncbi:uncharacterized protein LOC125035277 [Penaeus chinensis]|uniref:uncharacterized protein LOC125035277 n=1 Tax=Penaeus chinensis TaxID=139456 RepID=UPI001FB5DF98|nr:uncharacterized protein LOC125035277 [Penaeus chinensis]
MGNARWLLLLLGLAVTVTATQAGVLSWLEGEASSGGELQADQPNSSEEQSDDGDNQIKRLVEAMHGSFVELATKRNTWYDRYDILAQQAANNSRVITELLGISRIAMPIIWNTFMAKNIWQRTERMQHGVAQVYSPLHDASAPHPLRSLTTSLTQDQDFAVEVILSLTTEANVGFRLMWEPEGGAAFDWAQDDILFGLHLRRFHYDGDREVVMDDKYDGEWTPDAAFVPSEHWPDIKPGRKFKIIVMKKGSCFMALILSGEDIYVQLPKPMGYTYRFCPKPRRQAKVSEWAARPLRVVLNEDNPGRGEVRVHALTWYPASPVTSNPWQHN